MDSPPLDRIGYWCNEKKSRKFNGNEFSNVCRAYGYELIKIDFDHPLEEQGPFVAIIHKLSNSIVRAESGDLPSKAICETFQKYVDSHPHTIVIDPLPNVKNLLNRYHQYKSVADNLSKKGNVFIPAFVNLPTANVEENLAKMKAAGVDFPLVCKPTLAHGSTLAHQMSIIFNEEGLKDIIPPCVAQKFINHNAVLFKLFTIGNRYFMIKRPSLKNFSAGDQKTIFFNSNNISKPHSACELNELDDNEPLTPLIWPEKEIMDYIVEVVYKCTGLNLLGIDIIIDNETGHYGVVDINIFPGYGEVDNFFELLCELITEKMTLIAAGKDEANCKPMLMMLPENYQKFSFDSADIANVEPQPKANIPSAPKCFCCPISSICLNGLHSEPKQSKVASVSTKSGLDSKFRSQDCIQDDSGIETSDSCDEKKEPCHRTMKRLHSRILSGTI